MGKCVCSGNKSKRSITELVHPINPSWEGRRILGNQIVSTLPLSIPQGLEISSFVLCTFAIVAILKSYVSKSLLSLFT